MTFVELRDAAIQSTVTGNSWQPFYEFCVENDLVIPGPCPREKFAMVMLCQYLLLKRRGDTEPASAVKADLNQRGFTIASDERSLTNRHEDNRPVAIPDCLLMFEGEPDGRDDQGTDQGGSGLDTGGSPTIGDLPRDSSGLLDGRKQGLPVPVRRKVGQAHRPNSLP